MQLATATVRNVRLGGILGQKFGRTHRLAVRSPAEAIHALCTMIPGFEEFLIRSKELGLVFAVFIGDRNLAEGELRHPSGEGDLRFVPVVQGAKSGGLLTIVGAIMVVVGIFLIWTPFGAPLIGIGLGLMAAGVAMMLAPQPKDEKSSDEADNKASYAFNGPVNTQAQGNPVPVLYGGPIHIGSAVISAAIDTAEGAYIPKGSTTSTTVPPSGGGSALSHAIASVIYQVSNP